MSFYKISTSKVSLQEFNNIVNDLNCRIGIDVRVRKRVMSSRRLLDNLVDDGRIIYGVNTSMGGFVNYLVPIEHAEELQNNLLSSVASNVGEYFDDKTVRAAMLARIISLSKGVSAIELNNLLILIAMFNKCILPCIPKKGSLGASGDLGPLAFIALVATGKWKAKYRGKVMSGGEVMRKARVKLMKLNYKEGLALINGTSAMTGLGAVTWAQTDSLLRSYEFISALSFEGLATKTKPFDPRVHKRKLHQGQNIFAKRVWKILASSKLAVKEKEAERDIRNQNHNNLQNLDNQIEDAYSLRCSPQILGPIYDSLKFTGKILEDELNSSSDNPLVIPEEGDVFHNGHFHGQYVAMVMDLLSICLTSLSNLSDRRIDRFMDKNNSNGLPAFLCKERAGIRLGLMGGQFMSTSLTAENRSLCVPLSIQSLTSTGDFQDIVSFGLIAARRCAEILDNTISIISFELLCACQAVDIRGAAGLSLLTRPVYREVRKVVPYLSRDTSINPFIEKLRGILMNQSFSRKLSSLID